MRSELQLYRGYNGIVLMYDTKTVYQVHYMQCVLIEIFPQKK